MTLELQLEKHDYVLQELAQIQDGWFDGDGKAPHTKALEGTRLIIAHCLAEQLPLPEIGANVRGAVVLNWRNRNLMIEVHTAAEEEEHTAYICVHDQQRKNATPRLSLQKLLDKKQLGSLLRRPTVRHDFL